MDVEHSNSGTIDLQTLLAELPACKHCRTRRKRCDTKLPSCKNCAKTERECVFYDHVLNEELPRNYIASLVDHLEVLQERNDSTITSAHPKRHSQRPPQYSMQSRQYTFGFANGSYRYIGSQSPILHLCSPNSETGQSEPPAPRTSIPSYLAGRDGSIPPALHGHLLRLFFASVHCIYPVLDSTATWLSPDVIMGLADHPTRAFILQMVYAIACRCDHVNHPHLLHLASAAHERALQLLDKTTAEQSTATLQMAIMLVLYTMLDPASGNISQQLGFATRLAIDLAGTDSDEEPSTLSTLHKIVYCLENSVCSVLVRPTSLPEPLIALDFSTESPLDYQCLLYIIQSRIRCKVLEDSLRRTFLNVSDDKEMMHKLHPNILFIFWQTRIMLDRSARNAEKLIMACSKEGYTATFLTPFWLHESARVVLSACLSAQGPSRSELMLAHGQATALFGRFSSLWGSADILLKDLQDSLRTEKENIG